ncbi:polysaccharide biosynthesis/export family protein [Ideonella sp. BN130291]|uniref:polysaccharide biosynthesis/export family protein n=1 Tax=Ideonella sp. BN130291 TaxID=3112940 RepID=UPI002E2696F1|nr:polysaccharide biosynthesis/export family protein [Ideonella sp. BN130291]
MRHTASRLFILALCAALLCGCAQLPNVGPSRKDVEQHAPTGSIQLVQLTGDVTQRLLVERRQRLFSEALGAASARYSGIGPGDALEVNIWEAPPATLFGGAASELRGSLAASRGTALPEQVVDRDGNIVVPFAGKVSVRGRTISEIEADITGRLKGKANKPEVIVRQTRNSTSTVTVVGEVATNTKLQLTPAGEKLLDALAAAGGVRQPVSKVTIQVTRGSQYFALPLDTVIRDPRQNVPLWAGDVVTAMVQPLSFTALGSTGKNEEVNFETPGISLAQALARAGGLIDSRSDVQGVFVFRFEPSGALDWPRQPVSTTADGQVPVVYQLDMKDPTSFFLMQNFAMKDKDILYVSNAPAAELQKFLNIVFSVAYPVLTAVQTTK